VEQVMAVQKRVDADRQAACGFDNQIGVGHGVAGPDETRWRSARVS